ncbi:hypothetical protein [Mycobacterium sp. ITM-2016-00318]|uniref:hypothetical protein n=1 Tax=Mycobacterium sp. ITM-2016-00318 TaxID=2099693 RepID=UPI000CF8AB07|nr:hypothetical protein [Mycobacterium sp. ITM-2016-00318]WNG92565.1 hypothetical protein C6A82_024790 [Mycobacterium sp. ITM-2016-00318]
MTTTTDVVREPSLRSSFRQHGYFFREAAIVTIAMGLCMHLCRVIFGDETTLQYVMTPATDKVLLVPMTYAAITGILLWRRVEFATRAHRVFFTWSLVYIGLSVPMHVYFGVVRDNVDFYFDFFPVWFSYLLFPFYAALLTMFSRLHYRN